jgi:hypothetical protein
VLDGTHKLMLRAVAQGLASNDSPALRRLVATGLVEQRAEGRYEVTPAGRVALEHDEPRRWASAVWLLLVLTVSVVVVVAAVIAWLT